MNLTHKKIPAQSAFAGKRGSFFQPKLTVNKPNDIYEQEADAMSEKVMRMAGSENGSSGFSSPVNVQRKCDHCEEEEKELHRKQQSNEALHSSPVEQYLNSLSGGRALTESERSFFEPKIGHDFSNVMIHTDEAANESAKSIRALAYTSGNHIVFGSGQYQPATGDGKKLMAHELTHVVQQSVNQQAPIQRQPDDDKKEHSSDVSKELEKDGLFQKLEKKIKDKILEEIDKAPETITKAILDQIIDTFAPPDYKEGLKKAGEAIIKTITNKKTPSTSICDAIPGYHEGGSRDFKGQCCLGSFESAEACCPKDRFAPNEDFGKCCQPGEVVTIGGKCMKPGPVDTNRICVTPGKKDAMGKCCYPPLEVIEGICMNRPEPEPEPPPFSLTFTIGVIDDYNIDESVINGRQQSHFNQVKNQVHQFMEACPASMIYITGFADKPGTEEHNMDLGQRRADHVKFLLQLDLMKINFGGLPPLIFTRSEGENNPVDTKAGEKFSSRNRRVEIEFHSMCPALNVPAPKIKLPVGKGLPFKFNIGSF